MFRDHFSLSPIKAKPLPGWNSANRELPVPEEGRGRFLPPGGSERLPGGDAGRKFFWSMMEASKLFTVNARNFGIHSFCNFVLHPRTLLAMMKFNFCLLF